MELTPELIEKMRAIGLRLDRAGGVRHALADRERGLALLLDHRDDFVVGEHAIAALRGAEHRSDQLLRRLVAALLEPVDDVRLARVVPDLDLLFLAEHARRHSRADA